MLGISKFGKILVSFSNYHYYILEASSSSKQHTLYNCLVNWFRQIVKATREMLFWKCRGGHHYMIDIRSRWRSKTCSWLAMNQFQTFVFNFFLLFFFSGSKRICLSTQSTRTDTGVKVNIQTGTEQCEVKSSLKVMRKIPKLLVKHVVGQQLSGVRDVSKNIIWSESRVTFQK